MLTGNNMNMNMSSSSLTESGYMMDPSMQKQMAALVNTQAMIANHRPVRPGTISAFGGSDGHPPANAPFFDPTMSIRPGQSAAPKQRQSSFLNALATFMIKRNTPLPPQLTGLPTPNYDPATSLFKIIEPSQTEVGSFRLAGKDVDLCKLWTAVMHNGGSQTITANKGWHTLLPLLDLPEHTTEPGPNGSTSIPFILQTYYSVLLFPFEEAYKKNMQEKANMMKNMNSATVPPQSSPPSQRPGSYPPSKSLSDSASQISADVLDSDPHSLKRKSEPEDGDIKRARQKTDPESLQTEIPSATDRASVGPTPSSKMPTRKKIEYVPYAREVESYGGRDLRQLDSELALQRRQLRDVNEWGIIDTDGLTLSIRSRLSSELSYALTTLSLLSTMKGQSPGSGFPISQCQDLLDEALDLLEECAFQGLADERDSDTLLAERLVTHRELLNTVQESECELFANMRIQQGSKDPNLGPLQRPGNLVLAVVNIIRNLSIVQDNMEFLSKHDRLIDMLLRLCDVAPHSVSAASPALSLSDLITIRKDVLYVLSSVAGLLHISDGSPQSMRLAIRIFRLIASYLIDPSDAVSPVQLSQPISAPQGVQWRPPLFADVALEVCIRFSQADINRHTLSRIIPESLIRDVFIALVHRLPVMDADFQLMMREQWLSYLEKTILCLYSLAFLASPSLKARLKADRKLGFKGMMLRMVQRFLITQESRTAFMVSAKRAIETMKILDDCENLFDTPKAVGPTIAFGMGYGEVGENASEKGTGLLGGHRELAWDMLMLREVWADDTMFSELESLARVDIRFT